MIAWPPVAVGISWAITGSGISFKWPAVAIGLLGLSGLGLASFLAVSGVHDAGKSSNSDLIVGDTILNVFQVLPASVWAETIPLLSVSLVCATADGDIGALV